MRILITLAIFGGMCLTGATERYEAENAIVDENSVQKVADTEASGGYYVNMKEGTLSFKITMEKAGFYTLWTSYSQPNDTNGKIQNILINGVSTGQISFPKVDTFVYTKASSKIRLSAGENTVDITKSWGWVNIDYIEVDSYIETPFNISKTPVNQNASENTRKMYGFLLDNFQKKIVSGVMTNRVMQNDGKYTPNTVENQEEVNWIIQASGKAPALLGLDFMHATGVESNNEWFTGYTKATVSLAEDIFNKGGIPAYCWHWKDPSHKVDAFYSPSSGNSPNTDFDLKKVFTDASCETPNTASTEYKSVIRDLDIIAGYLKSLWNKGIPVVWRPLHEASGKWFWWGYSGPKACKGLYHIMFDRFTNYHGLNNLIWVWTTDEATDALEWYPGDQYVDIVGRDYYYDEITRRTTPEKNHGSLVASFEKVKEIFSGKKIIALSENGAVPFPEDLQSDGAGWSYFMPWYGNYTMDQEGQYHDNTNADWEKIMNSNYVVTLDEMPGWNNYTVSVSVKQLSVSSYCPAVRFIKNKLELTSRDVTINSVKLFTTDGTLIASLKPVLRNGQKFQFETSGISRGTYIIKSYGTSGITPLTNVFKVCKIF